MHMSMSMTIPMPSLPEFRVEFCSEFRVISRCFAHGIPLNSAEFHKSQTSAEKITTSAESKEIHFPGRPYR
jgi:hypothetical protein